MKFMLWNAHWIWITTASTNSEHVYHWYYIVRQESRVRNTCWSYSMQPLIRLEHRISSADIPLNRQYTNLHHSLRPCHMMIISITTRNTFRPFLFFFHSDLSLFFLSRTRYAAALHSGISTRPCHREKKNKTTMIAIMMIIIMMKLIA